MNIFMIFLYLTFLFSICHSFQSVNISSLQYVYQLMHRIYRKRHMENPNIHNIPYIRSRDQKRWKGHSKKIISKEETTER